MADHRLPGTARNDTRTLGDTFTLTVQPDEYGGELLILSGELDLASAPLVSELLSGLAARRGQPAPEHVVVDLAELQFLDAAGLSVLIEAREHLTGEGGTMALRGAPPCVRRMLEITQLTGAFDLEPAS